MSANANVARHLEAMARERPDATALICPSRRGPRKLGQRARWSELTFAELNALADRYAAGFAEAGIARGDRAVVMLRPGEEFFAATFALFKLGAVVVLIDPGIGIKNLSKCLAEAAPSAFIGVTKAQAARAIFKWARPTVRALFTLGPRLFWGGRSLAALRARPAAEFAMAEMSASDPAAILFTSGATGISKGALYTHGVFAAQVEYLKTAFAIHPGEVDVATFPLFALFDPALGMTAVIPEMDASRPASAKPENLLAAIEDHGATQMFGSPALFDRLMRFCEARGIRLNSLRRALSAGAPVRVDILERMTRVLAGGARIETPYGATEALPVSSIASAEILGETRNETAEGGGICVGRPVPQVEVEIIRIADEAIETWNDALRAAPGEIGEIAVAGPAVTREYYGRPEATRLAKIRGEGGKIYHRMGDVGRIDARGRLWFCGRKAHRVETAEGTLFTIPCEAIFNQHPRVFRSALVGIGSRGRQRPALCVELEKDAARADRKKLEQELLAIAAARPQLAAIRTVLFHPAFPVDARHNAKIAREKLAVWAEKRLR